MPPLFLQESSHSGGILVDSRIYTRIFPGMDWNSVPWNGQEWNFMAFHLFVCYIIVYLFVMDNKQCLFGNHVCQTSPLSSSHHHHHVRHHCPQSSSPPPPTVIAHNGLNPTHTGFHYPTHMPTLNNNTRASTTPDQNGNHCLLDCNPPPICLGSTSHPDAQQPHQSTHITRTATSTQLTMTPPICLTSPHTPMLDSHPRAPTSPEQQLAPSRL